MKWIFGGAALVLVVCYALSWLVTCGIVYLVTLCFDLTFTWLMATGVWLVMCLLKSLVTVNVKK